MSGPLDLIYPPDGIPGEGGTGTSSNQVQGTAASNAAAVGNPVLTGGKYNATPQTFDDGDVSNLQSDSKGYLKITEQYAPVYEDNTNGKAVIEHRYTSSGSITADTLVKTGAGLIHTIIFSCDDAAPTAGTFTLFDNTAESGTEIFSHTFTTTPFMPFSIVFNHTFSTGLYAGFTTTADVNVVITYR